jgi:PTS system nitrogen regulatory IIA component
VIDFPAIVSRAATRAHGTATSKKRALQDASELLSAAQPSLSSRVTFDQLLARERLGSTGLGEGVAIPHCRLEEAQRAIGGMITLAEPIDFDASDGQPVDLLFVLVVPREGREVHLQMLAALARVFSDPDNRARLRAAASDDALYDALCSMLAAPE